MKMHLVTALFFDKVRISVKQLLLKKKKDLSFSLSRSLKLPYNNLIVFCR